jgi:SAM-dependent methyltransferase
MTSDPRSLQERVRRFVKRAHDTYEDVNDSDIDEAIGLCRSSAENQLTLSKLLLEHGQHRMELGDLGYKVIRDLYSALDPAPEDIILDLGCGYGRIALYGALLWGQRVVGIEIIPERVREASRVRETLDLRTIEFVQGDVLTSPWPAASIYLVLNTVFPPLMPLLIERLYLLSRSRRIVIASLSSSNGPLSAQAWLKEHVPNCFSATPPVGLRVYESIPDRCAATGTTVA